MTWVILAFGVAAFLDFLMTNKLRKLAARTKTDLDEKVLEVLPPGDRAILMMKYSDDLSIRDIGEVLGKIHGKIEGVLQLLNQAEHVGIEPGSQQHIRFKLVGAGVGFCLFEDFFEVAERPDQRGNTKTME